MAARMIVSEISRSVRPYSIAELAGLRLREYDAALDDLPCGTGPSVGGAGRVLDLALASPLSGWNEHAADDQIENGEQHRGILKGTRACVRARSSTRSGRRHRLPAHPDSRQSAEDRSKDCSQEQSVEGIADDHKGAPFEVALAGGLSCVGLVSSYDATDPATDKSPEDQAQEEQANDDAPPFRTAPLRSH